MWCLIQCLPVAGGVAMFEAWTLREAEVAAREERLRIALRALGDEQRLAFYRDYNPRLKDPDTYATLNWLMLTGLHHFYLGKLGRGLLNLGIMVAGILLLFLLTPLGIAVLVFILVMELPALFRSQVIVADHNTRMGEALLQTLQRR